MSFLYLMWQFVVAFFYNMIIDVKDFDIDRFFIQLELENVVNKANFHCQIRGGHDLGTTKNPNDIEVNIEL